MIIAILIPYILFQTMVYCLFFSKIFGETQDEVSIFSLLHTIIIFFFLIITTVFFTKFLLGDLFSGTNFWSSFGMESYGGGLTTGMVSDEGDLEKNDH